jgi:hypothetical protein
MRPKCIVDFEDRLGKYESAIDKLSALSDFQKRNFLFSLAKNTDKRLQRYKNNLKKFYFQKLRYIRCKQKKFRSSMSKIWQYLRNAFLMYSSEHTIFLEWFNIYYRKKLHIKGSKKCYKHIRKFKKHVLRLCE